MDFGEWRSTQVASVFRLRAAAAAAEAGLAGAAERKERESGVSLVFFGAKKSPHTHVSIVSV
jgi:hypothetical protein